MQEFLRHKSISTTQIYAHVSAPQMKERHRRFQPLSDKNRFVVLPDPSKTPLGAKLRCLRKRQGLTIPDLARLTGVSHNTISRLERGTVPLDPAIVGKILAHFGQDLCEVFQGTSEPQDQIVPVKDFGSWLKNFRLKKGIRQVDLAKALGIHKVSLHRYEKGVSKPDEQVLQRLIHKYDLEKDEFLRRYLENGNP